MAYTYTLKPCLLVVVQSDVNGGVSYDRKGDYSYQRADGALVSQWETTKIIVDPDEWQRASVARGSARARITRVCARSAFGLICPTDKRDALATGIREMREIAAAFNAQARTCRLDCRVLVGEIQASERDTMDAIASDVRRLLAEMEQGIRNANPEAIRAAANKARAMGQILGAETQAKVSAAIEQARAAAAEIVTRLETTAEGAAVATEDLNREAIRTARFAFLDLADPSQVVEAPPAPVRALDTVEPTAMPAPQASQTREIEIADPDVASGNTKLAAAPADVRTLEV